MYTTLFQLRAKDSAGTVVATFKEAAGTGRHVSLSRGAKIQIDREGLDYSDQSYFLGYKQLVDVDFTAEGITIPGDVGFSSLQAVLNALPAGGTFEYSLDGGLTWVPCTMEDPEPEKPADKNVANKLTISLTSRSAVANSFRTS